MPAQVRAFWSRANALNDRVRSRDDALQSVSTHFLRAEYPQIAAPLVDEIESHEVKVCSQNGEDGILLHIFSVIGVTDRRFVEFGCGDGRECNSANLSLNFGWSGLLMDGSAHNVEFARRYYRDRLGAAQAEKISIGSHRVTAENINALLSHHRIVGPCDLLSIDIDGNDYWVWRAITSLQPRVVVVEYNPSFGPVASVTIPYDPTFNRSHRFRAHPSGLYYGASLAALARLGNEKGYSLVGCDSTGTNAFFVQRRLVAKPLVETSTGQAFRSGRGLRRAQYSQADQEGMIPQLPLVRVD